MKKTLAQKFSKILQHKNICYSASQTNLTSISLNQLETKLKFFNNKKHRQQNLKSQIVNNKEINVCSPFYDKIKAHKQNCKCPYHRKKKFSLQPYTQTHKNTLYDFTRIRNHYSNQKQLNNTSLIHDKTSKEQFQLHQFNSNQYKKRNQASVHHMSHTHGLGFTPKIKDHNYSYEQFLKDCENHLVTNKESKTIKPRHNTRKGVKQIFEFINKNLDYTVEKMARWVNSIQKDKDYGQFYIDRFKEIKKNYQIGLRKKMTKNQIDTSFPTPNKFRLTHSHKSLNNQKQYQNNLSKDQIKRSSLQSDNSDHQNKLSQKYKGSNQQAISLQKIVSQLQLSDTICNQNQQNLMGLDIVDFEQLFNQLEVNIVNKKYSSELIQKFDKLILGELHTKYSDNASIKNLKRKMQIISKAYDILRKEKNRHLTNFSDRKSQSIRSNSRGFNSSKRMTQNGQNRKNRNSINGHSGNSSFSDSLQESDKNQYYIDTEGNQNYQAITQDQNELDEDGLNSQKRYLIKKFMGHGQNVRRSKIINPYQFNFLDDHTNYDAIIQDTTQRDMKIQKHILANQKDIFNKAQKFLFDKNMGKAIIKKDDTIFTAKRKVRVIKNLLKENPNTSEAAQLQKYIKTIQEKVIQKTRKDKKIALKSTQNTQMTNQELWKWICLDNLGWDLIFYDLSSKIKKQDNEDLCILLNEVRLNTKKFQNIISYKRHLLVEDAQESKKNKGFQQQEDILIQEGMENMKFQPEFQSKQRQSNLLNRKKRKSNTHKLKMLSFAENNQMIEFFQNQGQSIKFGQTQDYNLDDYGKLKKMMKYARIRFPQSFEKYLKNTSIRQNSSFCKE